MKKLGMLMISFLLVLVAAGCGNNSTTDAVKANSSNGGGGGKKIKIGMTVLDLANPYFKQIADGAKKKADELGVELVINDPKSDPTKQMDAVDNFIADKVDGVILTAVDTNEGNTAAKKVKQAGIPILSLAHPLEEEVGSQIKLDEYKYGQMGGTNAGNWIKDKIKGDVEVAILDYPKLPQIIDRAKGIADKIKEIAPNAKIVAQQSASTPEEGMKAMETILQAHPNVKVIQAINDAAALGAFEAMKAAGKTGDDVYVGGLDATDEAKAKIKEKGIYRATVDIDPTGTGVLALTNMMKLVKKESVDKLILVPMSAVTADNVK